VSHIYTVLHILIINVSLSAVISRILPVCAFFWSDRVNPTRSLARASKRASDDRS